MGHAMAPNRPRWSLMFWWPVWALAMFLTGAPLAHNLIGSDVWTHVDVWAPAVNTGLLIWLARVQLRAARNVKRSVKETKEVAREAHHDLLEAVRDREEWDREEGKEDHDGEA